MRVDINNIVIPINKNQNSEIMAELTKRGLEKEWIDSINYKKRSIDSRKRSDIKFIYNLEVILNKTINLLELKDVRESKGIEIKNRKSKNLKGNIAIIGTGPAGLFAALRLCEHGYKPLIFERGAMVDKRVKDVEEFYSSGVLNENSNIQFGEGGAGTFSDGKLTTRIKSEYIEKVFSELVESGAGSDILYDYKPHIGTDVLVDVIKNLREKIIKMGGKFYFDSCLNDIEIENSKIKSIMINEEKIEVAHLLLAIGHSSRDTYRMLHRRGVTMESKDFAIGARIEHRQESINKMQFGDEYQNPLLGAASYNYTFNSKDKKNKAFSFCMCPGGEIVNASSSNGMSLVNGMSSSRRDGEFANSAVVAAVGKSEFGDSLFAGMEMQEKIEKQVYKACGKYGALYQNLFDYIDGKKTADKIESSYKMDLVSYDLNRLFTKNINKSLKMAFNSWSRNKIFVSREANLIGAETRTSAPIRINRDVSGVSINTTNLYPLGEGAGYAGGIISAAVDGIKIVDFNFSEGVD